ncbi:MAG: chorismate synthase [candidate division FCPU426 bacterium]
MLRFLTAGESHGQGLTVVLEGLPAGLSLTARDISRDLARRQQGYGRGGRMQIERDQAQITAGVRLGETLGSPLALWIPNRDWANWQALMAVEPAAWPKGASRLTRPRPGHADLVGALKYGRTDMRDILERASARETAARVAAGAAAKALLKALGVTVGSWVERIGSEAAANLSGAPASLARRAERSDVRCPQPAAASRMRRAIDRAAAAGDTLGGVFAVSAWGAAPGVGSHVHWDRRLDARLAGALASIPAIKGVEFGEGFAAAARPGSQVHDVINYRRGGFGRKTNHAGGLEGGMTTGEPLLLRLAMKPIATLRKPLASVDLATKKSRAAGYERSDVCAVPAAAVVGEAVLALELAKAYQEKFGGDSVREMAENLRAYRRAVARR